jgi:hypothetical protein
VTATNEPSKHKKHAQKKNIKIQDNNYNCLMQHNIRHREIQQNILLHLQPIYIHIGCNWPS